MDFIRSLFTGGPKFYEPSPRIWHYAAPVGEKLLMWGGQTQDWSSESMRKLASIMEVYDPYLELWEQHKTNGVPPAGLYNGACASLLDSLYSYGGIDGSSFYGGLHHFNPASMCWNEVEVFNSFEGPMQKVGCGMLAYQRDKLLVAGGYGIPTTVHQTRARFHRNTRRTDGRGWTNEVHLFHLKESIWTSPRTTGIGPPPCAGFSLTSIDPKRAVFFGGNQPEQGRVNDVYILDMESMHWTKMDKSGESPWPVERIQHAACCINYGQEHPQLLISGGRDKDNKVLGDAWLLDVDSATWKKLTLPADFLPRGAHTATAFSLAPGLTEVTMFGGYYKYHSRTTNSQLPKIAETTALVLKPTETPPSGRSSNQEWFLVGIARKGQLGSPERLREKMTNMQQRKFEHIQPTQVGSIKREGVVQERLLAANHGAEQRARDSEARAQQAERNAHEAQARVHDLEQQLRHSNQRAQEAEQRVRTDATERVHELEQQLRDVTSRVQQAEIRATEAERQLQQEQQFWLVRRDEVELTHEILGEGGWGAVKVANFRRARVAAKCLYRIIASPHNHRLFRRELTMAARLRHPNLLQFIGATLEGELIILTELMPTSLRAELERGALPYHQIISISLDVARALNYLHLMQPSPIIHRDLSSANVLMEPKPDNSWRAKVSDYGTINLLKNLQTAMPGNPIYAAPESKYPCHQSPKMDIFSFGVLLVEINTAIFPDFPDREHLIQSIADLKMVSLISECTAGDKRERPPAAEIITRLSEMQPA